MKLMICGISLVIFGGSIVSVMCLLSPTFAPYLVSIYYTIDVVGQASLLIMGVVITSTFKMFPTSEDAQSKYVTQHKLSTQKDYTAALLWLRPVMKLRNNRSAQSWRGLRVCFVRYISNFC